MTRTISKSQPPLFDELVVDNFAGGGGASLGIELGIGRAVDIAINHNPKAVAMHKANHPNTRHYCEDVWDVDPVEACAGRPVGFAWFSPDCKHFSKAKGGKPVSREIRGLAWIVVKWAQKVRPRIIMLENVEEFQDWGPLVHACDSKGKPRYDKHGNPELKPCGVNKGATFYKWVRRLESLGYKVEWDELRACDYGAPTIRKRLFLIARCDGLPIVWPGHTRGPKTDKPYRTAADCIDWAIPVPSIFERKRPLAENTMKRIARGLKKFVFKSADPFIVPIANYNGHVAAHDINEPLRTITAWPKGGSFALAVPHIQRQFGQGTGSSIESPVGCITAGGMGKTALLSAFVAKHFGGMTGVDIRTPFPTITQRGTQNQIVTSHIMKMRGSNVGHRVNEPLHTVSAGGLHHAEVRAFLIKYFGTAVGQVVGESLHTVTQKDRFGLVTVRGEHYQIVDIGMRMLQPRELYRAQGFPDEYVIDPIYNGKPLTKTDQVAMCGNSVSPPPAMELVKANVKTLSGICQAA